MKSYIKENPRRLALKRANRELFRIRPGAGGQWRDIHHRSTRAWLFYLLRGEAPRALQHLPLWMPGEEDVAQHRT